MALQLLTIPPAIMAIGTAIASTGATIIAFLAGMVTTRVTLVITTVAIIAALTTAFVFLIRGLMASIETSLPSEVTAFASAVLPSNLSVCIGVLVSAQIARWAYDKNIEVAKMLVK